MSRVTPNGIDRLREIVRDQVRQEGLRPFATRIGVPLGHVRSLIGKRPVQSSTIESVAGALGLKLTMESSRAVRQSVPEDITKALKLAHDCSVGDVVDAIHALQHPVDGIALERILREAKASLGRLVERVSQVNSGR